MTTTGNPTGTRRLQRGLHASGYARPLGLCWQCPFKGNFEGNARFVLIKTTLMACQSNAKEASCIHDYGNWTCRVILVPYGWCFPVPWPWPVKGCPTFVSIPVKCGATPGGVRCLFGGEVGHGASFMHVLLWAPLGDNGTCRSLKYLTRVKAQGQDWNRVPMLLCSGHPACGCSCNTLTLTLNHTPAPWRKRWRNVLDAIVLRTWAVGKV